jgi:hypothetical protein
MSMRRLKRGKSRKGVPRFGNMGKNFSAKSVGEGAKKRFGAHTRGAALGY